MTIRGILFFVTMTCLMLALASPANACRRCGHSQCIYQAPVVQQYAAPVVQPNVTNFVLQNNYPQPLIGGGSTIYGGYDYLSPEVYANQAARLAESATQLQRMSLEGVERVTTGSLALAEQHSTLAAILLASGKIEPVQQELRLSIKTDKYGQTTVERLTEESGEAGDAHPQPNRGTEAPLLSKKCGSCHSGTTPKAGLILDGSSPITGDIFARATKAMSDGTMPKDGRLTAQEAGSLMEELLDIWGKEQ